MARFVRDERRTFPFTWLVIGGFFAATSVWAMYAEFVTRVPWQKHQQAFFEMELEEATRLKETAQADFDAIAGQDPLKSKIARRDELQAMVEPAEGQAPAPGDYTNAKQKLARLDRQFLDAEGLKTFGTSDLDEAYYYRNLAEYERDAAKVAVLKATEAAYPGDRTRADQMLALYADPPVEPAPAGTTKAIARLQYEAKRADAHVKAIAAARGEGHPPELLAALHASELLEQAVGERVTIEQKHQARIDDAVAKMSAVDGPTDPFAIQKDPAKLAAARAAACQDHTETRNCVRWLELEPVEAEYKALKLTLADIERPLKDAEARWASAKAKAEPELDLDNPMLSLIGPYQIEQVVTDWMDFKREVDIQQVDRCHTCHMGVSSAWYTGDHILAPNRTHPRREQLLGAHPVETFGCTACHQGQGRATDPLAHSGWKLELHHGEERWHFAGDHYWEDPLLPVGKLEGVIIDARNDELEVKVGKAKAVAIKLDPAHYYGAQWEAAYGNVHGEHVADKPSAEAKLFGALQQKIQEALPEDVAKAWKADVRKIDNRVRLGLLPEASVPAGEAPRLTVRFVDADLAALLGFRGVRELDSKEQPQPIFTATLPPEQPIRAADAVAHGEIVDSDSDYRYLPPRGAAGLQIPDEQRNHFIQALPEIESGCLRCHVKDADLRPRVSQGAHVESKLAYQKAAAARTKDPAAYRQAHGTDQLPTVVPTPFENPSLAPTLDEGRQTFLQLNCLGCHLLEGIAPNKDAGPQLDQLSAKVSPEWLLGWLRDPRGWRSKTSMPNLWPAPLDPASKRPYPAGSPEHERWLRERADETVAVASFLWERSEAARGTVPAAQPGGVPEGTTAAAALADRVIGYANVPGASVELGQKVFEGYGCQGCHATVEAGSALPKAWRVRERDVAPTLANIGSKTSADWIAYWVEDPSRYWHGTSMPNLRLTRKEAASVGQYLATLKSKPVAAAPVAPAEVAMVADAQRRHEMVPCAAAAGALLSRVACGEKAIAQRGCFGCHRIGGFENAAPIGPELTGFSKKDVSTLDFGYAIADHHLQTTETFAALKLDSPRIFVRDRIELKMGDFDMSPREIRAVVTFLKGLINDTPSEKFDPQQKPEYAAAIDGRQLVENLNCRGCHMIEGRGADIDGWREQQLSADSQARAPFLDGEGARVQPEWLFDFLRKPGEHGIRPWLHPEWVWSGKPGSPGDVPLDRLALRMPSFDLTSEQWTAVVRYFATWEKQEYPYPVPQVAALTRDEKLYVATHMNSAAAGNCLSCHYHGTFPVDRGLADLGKMAPNFDEVRHRLRPEWVQDWLLRPANFAPYTKMLALWATVDVPKTELLPWPKAPNGEQDPFRSPPAAGWNLVPGFANVSGDRQTEMVRNFLFSIPPDTPFPAVGEEAISPMVDPEVAEALKAAAAAEQAADAERPPG